MSEAKDPPQKMHPGSQSRGAKTVVIGRGLPGEANNPRKPPLADSATLSLPWDLGDFVLTEVLAQGGMGKTFLGYRKTDSKQQVAVKIPISADAGLLDRFRNEVKILSQLEHPHIVRFVASGDCSGWRQPSPA